MKPGNVAGSLGKGLVAGAFGTAAMTVSSTLEAKIRKRDPSTAPADAAAKVLGIEPKDDEAKSRFSNLVHWGYGTGWGGYRGVLAGLGLPAPAASAAHFATVWGGELVMLPALEVAPPVKEWEPEEIAIDVWHHLVYVAATALAYRFLDRRTDR